MKPQEFITPQVQRKLVIWQSLGIIVKKVRKQGWSPTPADVLVGI